MEFHHLYGNIHECAIKILVHIQFLIKNDLNLCIAQQYVSIIICFIEHEVCLISFQLQSATLQISKQFLFIVNQEPQ